MLAFADPDFIAALDEERFDLRAKKLFLFGPERMGRCCIYAEGVADEHRSAG